MYIKSCYAIKYSHFFHEFIPHCSASLLTFFDKIMLKSPNTMLFYEIFLVIHLFSILYGGIYIEKPDLMPKILVY